MSVYRQRADAQKKYSGYKTVFTLAVIGFAILAIISNRWESVWQGRYPHAPDLPALVFTLTVLMTALSAFFLVAAWLAPARIFNLQIRVASEGVFRQGGVRGDLFLPRDDITGYEQHAKGLLLRTADPRRRIQIPSDLDGYAECRREIDALGIHQIDRATSRQWLLTVVIPIALLLAALTCILTKVHGQLAQLYIDIAFGVFALYAVIITGSAIRIRKPWRALLWILIVLTSVLMALSRVHHSILS